MRIRRQNEKRTTSSQRKTLHTDQQEKHTNGKGGGGQGLRYINGDVPLCIRSREVMIDEPEKVKGSSKETNEGSRRKCGETHLSHAVFEHVQFIRTVCSQAHSLTTRTRVAQGQQGSSRLLWCVRKMSSQRHISSFAALVTEHFYTFSPSQSHSLVKDPRTCADPRRSGGSIEIPSPTGRTQTPNSTYRAVIQAW